MRVRWLLAQSGDSSRLIERAQRCTTWLARRLHSAAKSESGLYAAAQAQGTKLEGLALSISEKAGVRNCTIAVIDVSKRADSSE